MEPTLPNAPPAAPSHAAAPSPRAVLVGRHGRRYALGASPIGSGAQAEVWPAERDDGHAVAIKLARPGRLAVDALDAEGRWLDALEAVGTRCTVPVFDRVDWEGRPGLVLPRLPRHVGELVRARVDADRGRALEAVLAVAEQLVRSLAHLHQAELGAGRLVHRDVKPENVLVDGLGGLHLADLGGSLLAGTPRDVGVFGSPRWAPPDQMLPGLAEPSPTWDTYAACVMIFAWIAGERPSFQVEPGVRLTPLGETIYARLRALISAGPADRVAATEALLRARDGVRYGDVIAPDARPGLPARDRARLARGVAALADPATYGDEALEAAVDALTATLGRGMAPRPTPSPPNRYADADELADALASIARGLAAARRRRALLAPPSRVSPDPFEGRRWPRPVRRAAAPVPPPAGTGPRFWGGVLAVALVVGSLGGAALARIAEQEEAATGPDRVRVGASRGQGAPFHIGRTEVSNAAWRACVVAGACRALPSGPGRALLDGDRQPAVGVSWRDATAYCAWDAGRLPSEAEWERAAFGGPEGVLRRWPWGAHPLDCARANIETCGLGLTAAVDGFVDGASAWGALQMVGNAWEWTTTRGPAGTRVLRGGAFDTSATEMDRGARRRDHPDRALSTYSFRCVYPA